jgi:hypothetical protein
MINSLIAFDLFFNRRPEELLKGLKDIGFCAPSQTRETALPLLLANPLVLILFINQFI